MKPTNKLTSPTPSLRDKDNLKKHYLHLLPMEKYFFFFLTFTLQATTTIFLLLTSVKAGSFIRDGYSCIVDNEINVLS